MKRAFWYSGLVFLAVFAIMSARFAAGLTKGVAHADDFLLFLVLSTVVSLVPSTALFFILKVAGKRVFNQECEKQYKPSKNLFIAFGVAVLGLSIWFYVDSLKMADVQLAKQEESKKSAAEDAKKQNEAFRKEKERVAAMSPAERDAFEGGPIIRDGEAIVQRRKDVKRWVDESQSGKTPDFKANPIKTEEWDSLRSRLQTVQGSSPNYGKAQELLSWMKEEDRLAKEFVKNQEKAEADKAKTKESRRGNLAFMAGQSMREGLNDPKSVSDVWAQVYEARSAKEPDLVLCTEFRAKNAFNATIKTIGVWTLKGEDIKQTIGDAASPIWNKLCAHRSDGFEQAPNFNRGLGRSAFAD